MSIHIVLLLSFVIFIDARELSHGLICAENYTLAAEGLNCRTCHFDEATTTCIKVKLEGCYCQEGYVLDRVINRCVDKADCSPRSECPQNEYMVECMCEPQTCTQSNLPCTRNCEPGCECRPGYLRDVISGRCFPKGECPNRQNYCANNELFQECGTDCEQTCTLQNTVQCNPICVAGCFCIEGYVRDGNSGVCIKPENCLT